MAKIYYRKYKSKIDSGELTLEEAIDLVNEEVPAKWAADVIELLRKDYE